MTKFDFTVDDVARKVRALAAKRPDFVYTEQEERTSIGLGCSYTAAGVGLSGGEGCIVGQALSELGVSDRILNSFEGKGASTLIKFIALGDPFAEVSQKDKNTLIWIDTVQVNQDRSQTWGLAVETADDES